jgi:hypothetical protein
MPTKSVLQYAFFNKKSIPFTIVVQFFVELCLEKQARYLQLKDKEGRAPYECVLNNEVLASLLHPSNYEESFGNALRQELTRCLSLARQQEVKHTASQSLSFRVLQQVGLENAADLRTWPTSVQLLASLTLAPFFKAGVYIDRASKSDTTKEALTTLAFMPVAMVGAIPESLFWFILGELIRITDD